MATSSSILAWKIPWTEEPGALETPWTIAHQAPLPTGFPSQGYRSGLPFSSPGDLPSPGIKPESPELTSRFFTTEPPGKPMGL